MRENVSIDVSIIGAGVIGLSIAKVLKSKFPQYEIAVFEKMPFAGDHASGRNSGVLHAGLYYQRESLKKKLCLEGQALWQEWAKELSLEINHCGKYILARKEDEKRFFDLFEKAKNNGANVAIVSEKKIDELNQFVDADFAFFSSSTSVVDPSAIIKSLEQNVISSDVMLLYNHDVRRISKKRDGYLLELNELDVHSKYCINAAGAGAISIRKQLGLTNLTSELVKGHYLKTFSRFYSDSLLYPLPEDGLKGLGIHTCIDFDGTVKFGPDTENCDEINYNFTREYESMLKEEVSRSFKISKDKLHADFIGIRSKINNNGELFSDFWIESPLENYIELCGIESPGFTSAPAIANYILKFFS